MAQLKTNAMRIIEAAGIGYTVHSYAASGPVDGVTAAEKLGLPAEQVFKTLVTQGKSGAYFVFVIPAPFELDLKLAARAVSEKSVEMIPVREITRVTGYVRGGCSPVGMKKPYRTVIDQSARALPSMAVSAGKIGFQVELSPDALAGLTGAAFAAVVQDRR